MLEGLTSGQTLFGIPGAWPRTGWTLAISMQGANGAGIGWKYALFWSSDIPGNLWRCNTGSGESCTCLELRFGWTVGCSQKQHRLSRLNHWHHWHGMKWGPSSFWCPFLGPTQADKVMCVDPVDSCVDSEAKKYSENLGFPRLEVHLSPSQDRLDMVKFGSKLN